MNVIIGLFCSPECKFEADHFYKNLEKCNVSTVSYLKVYEGLQEMMSKVTDDKTNDRIVELDILTNDIISPISTITDCLITFEAHSHEFN